jgi:hypothetical protein
MHRPGVRDAAMVANYVKWRDANCDPVNDAREGYKQRVGGMWRDRFISVGGGQVLERSERRD